MKFYDCHAHQIGIQSGGLVIAIENERVGDMPVYSNDDLRKLKLPSSFIKVEYVTHDFCATDSKVVKYHPRYEKYNVDQVIKDINIRKPKAVVIDTLNEPYWTPCDYWNIAKQYPQITFLFSHSGGYDINKFLEMCHFSKNIWLDFSYIQNYFGVIGERPKYQLIEDSMKYALNSGFKNKVLFGADYPEFDQKDSLKWYLTESDIELLNKNYENFVASFQ